MKSTPAGEVWAKKLSLTIALECLRGGFSAAAGSASAPGSPASCAALVDRGRESRGLEPRLSSGRWRRFAPRSGAGALAGGRERQDSDAGQLPSARRIHGDSSAATAALSGSQVGTAQPTDPVSTCPEARGDPDGRSGQAASPVLESAHGHGMAPRLSRSPTRSGSSGLIAPRQPQASRSARAAPIRPALVAGLAGCLRARAVVALHLNYGLRQDSGEDERTCAELCARLGVELVVERPQLGEGNVQAEAREARYAARRAAAARSVGSTGWPPATPAPTSPRPCSTGSRPRPGRRALLGLPPRRGAVVRPLLALGPRRGAGAGRARRTPVPRRPHQRRAALRPQPDPQRGAARARGDRAGASSERSPRPRPSSPRRRRRSSGSRPRCSTPPGRARAR